MPLKWGAAFAVLLSATVALAQVAPSAKRPSQDDPKSILNRIGVEVTTLNLLHEKGLISDAEYDSAVETMGGAYAGEAPTLMLARWKTTFYGFVEADTIWDSTESLNDNGGSGLLARTGTFAGDHDRFMMGARNSRIGFRLAAPEWHRIRASAMLEMDFLGNQPPNASEAAFFVNPGFRIRHMNLKLETPIVDILIGQYWHLFGWQSTYQPNTVEIQGVPGEVYSRTIQIRLSKTIKTPLFTFDVAAAMMRPPQRDSGYPEGQAGVRVAFNKWTGLTTTGSTGTSIQPLSIGLSGDVRRFRLPEFSAAPVNAVNSPVGWGVAVDALVPILPARKDKKGNSLTLTGEYAYGKGIADLYSGLNFGVGFPALPNPTMATPAPTYNPLVDAGLVTWNAAGALELVQLQSYMIGLQYYLPGLNGRGWVSANYSHTSSNNAKNLGAANKVRDHEDWFDVNLFADVTHSVRLGLEYAYFRDAYPDGNTPVNHRVQFSGFYIF